MAYHPDESMSENSGDVPVNIDTLATEDGTTPEVGDKVTVQVDGSVSRIEGNCAYVTPENCNGEPPPHMDEGDAGDKLQRQAQEADESAGY